MSPPEALYELMQLRGFPSRAKHFQSKSRNTPKTFSEQILKFQVSCGWRCPNSAVPPSPDSPKLLWRLPGKLGVLGGVLGELRTAVETAGKSAVSLLLSSSEQGQSRKQSPQRLPQHPEFPRQFPQQSPQQFWGIRAVPVDGWGNGNSGK